MADDDARPRLRLTALTFACSDPRRLAGFYARLLGHRITTDEPGWVQVGPGPASGTTLSFEHDRAFTRPVWPSAPGGPNATAHLDIAVDDLEAAVAWAVGLGAQVDPHQPQDDVRVLRDPDGHPFCLYLPDGA